MPDRSITALANPNPASPAPSLPCRGPHHAVAQKAAPRLCRVRQAPSGHDGHLQKITAIANFHRFRHQPVKLAHGSSGYAGNTARTVRLSALATAYITPHYAPLPASAPCAGSGSVAALPAELALCKPGSCNRRARLRRYSELPAVVRNVHQQRSVARTPAAPCAPQRRTPSTVRPRRGSPFAWQRKYHRVASTDFLILRNRFIHPGPGHQA